MNGLLIAYYADDFTGATDALDSLTRSGVETVLFLEEVTPALLDRFPDARAIGVAGKSRSMAPSELTAELAPHFDRFSELSPPVVHYKVCSTFDSSPDVGSIGRAIDVAVASFDVETVPVSVGVPQLGRYVVFGNLFAAEGDEVYRIDRHPTMKDHPVTPMTEANLLDHLGAQTDRERGLVDVRRVKGGEVKAAYREETAVGSEIVFFDSLDEEDLEAIGSFLWNEADRQSEPRFVVGSSGVGYGLAAHWQRTGIVEPSVDEAAAGPVDEIVAVSGSASPVTDAQIGKALDQDFVGIRVRTADLVGGDMDTEIQRVVDEAAEKLDEGRSPLLYTARGPDDPAIDETKAAAKRSDASDEPENLVGRSLGRVLRELLARRPVPRVCVAGGDTSGHVTSQLDVYALTKSSTLAPGSPLCRAWTRNDAIDDFQIALKGGQLGGPEFFDRVRRGG